MTNDEKKTEELLKQYSGLVKSKARVYYMLGGDYDDIIQEGMIGLYKAICSFDETKSDNFEGFADMCIGRRIMTAVSSANRRKNEILNSAISIDDTVSTENGAFTLGEVISAGNDADPETNTLLNDMLEQLVSPEKKLLSKHEREVLSSLIYGRTYTEIAEAMGKTPKQIDNTIQRIRKKVKQLLA